MKLSQEDILVYDKSKNTYQNMIKKIGMSL